MKLPRYGTKEEKDMCKKVLIVLVVGVVALCAVFASNHSIEVSGSPFSFQNIKLDTPAEYNSKYGWGVKAGYRYSITPDVYVGTDVSYSNYKYGEEKNHYLIWTLMAMGGVLVDMCKAFKLDLGLGAGADLRFAWQDNKVKAYSSMDTDVICSLGARVNL